MAKLTPAVDLLDLAAHSADRAGFGLCGVLHTHHRGHYPSVAVDSGEHRGVLELVFLLRAIMGLGMCKYGRADLVLPGHLYRVPSPHTHRPGTYRCGRSATAISRQRSRAIRAEIDL
jgi:hypothetical protein